MSKNKTTNYPLCIFDWENQKLFNCDTHFKGCDGCHYQDDPYMCNLSFFLSDHEDVRTFLINKHKKESE